MKTSMRARAELMKPGELLHGAPGIFHAVCVYSQSQFCGAGGAEGGVLPSPLWAKQHGGDI